MTFMASNHFGGSRSTTDIYGRMQEVTGKLGNSKLGFLLTDVNLFAAELNIPYYPLLRRNVDCIIALDASADSQVHP